MYENLDNLDNVDNLPPTICSFLPSLLRVESSYAQLPSPVSRAAARIRLLRIKQVPASVCTPATYLYVFVEG